VPALLALHCCAKCGLTLRSSRPAPARHPGRREPLPMLLSSARAPCLHGRLSSNVRPHLDRHPQAAIPNSQEESAIRVYPSTNLALHIWPILGRDGNLCALHHVRPHTKCRVTPGSVSLASAPAELERSIACTAASARARPPTRLKQRRSAQPALRQLPPRNSVLKDLPVLRPT
jgi:hypothetical protein